MTETSVTETGEDEGQMSDCHGRSKQTEQDSKAHLALMTHGPLATVLSTSSVESWKLGAWRAWTEGLEGKPPRGELTADWEAGRGTLQISTRIPLLGNPAGKRGEKPNGEIDFISRVHGV